jgi:L-lactate dehydrogenase complex protein LldE
MRVALFYTCLVDLMRPSIGIAAVDLLEGAGCEVVIPDGQTCCGQPAWNSGDQGAARRLAKRVIAEFEPFEYIVIPSASCADQIRNKYPTVLAGEPDWQARAAALSPRVYELSDFLVSVLRLESVPGTYAGSVTYHDSCTGLRSLGIKAQPRALLAKVPGLSLREMPQAEECCGFGGTFAVKFGDVSATIAERKCVAVQATGADAVIGGDLGCLLNIEGKLRRMGDEKTEVLHFAELLAGAERVRRIAEQGDVPLDANGARR